MSARRGRAGEPIWTESEAVDPRGILKAIDESFGQALQAWSDHSAKALMAFWDADSCRLDWEGKDKHLLEGKAIVSLWFSEMADEGLGVDMEEEIERMVRDVVQNRGSVPAPVYFMNDAEAIEDARTIRQP